MQSKKVIKYIRKEEKNKIPGSTFELKKRILIDAKNAKETWASLVDLKKEKII